MAVIVETCVGICTNRAPMISCSKGLLSFIKEKNKNVIVTHCFFYTKALMSKILGENLREVLDQVAQMGKQICANMMSQHRRLLLHTNVRWL